MTKYDSDYYTYDEIQKRKMENVPDTLDKREGSIIFTATAPSSAVDAETYEELKLRYNEGFADTASREYLIRRCAEQGISPYPATYAIIEAVFVGVTPSVGDRYSVLNSDINYSVSSVAIDQILLTCETAGEVGNITSGKLVPILDTPGFVSSTISGVYSLGDEEESTEDLRARYYALFDFSRSFAGNVASFKEITNSLDGVGETKVVRAWNGGGTVKLIILDSTSSVPSPSLVEDIQVQIDPTIDDPNDSGGLGIAPIFARTTVVGARSRAINTVATITYLTGYNWTLCKAGIFQAIHDYYLSLAEIWEDSVQTEVKITRIMLAILGVPGVADVTAININGDTANIMLDEDEIPICGTINGESEE